MNKKEITEIKKQFTPANCAITRICGCYVDAEKNKKTKIKEALEPEMRFPEEYAAIIAKAITSRLNEHDKEIDEAIIKKYFQDDKDNE